MGLGEVSQLLGSQVGVMNISEPFDGLANMNITAIDSFIGISSFTQILLIIWTLIVVILGTGGNVLVLVGSIRYQALRMDRTSIFLLECVSATDLVLALTDFIPNLITLSANRWLFGKGFCVAESFLLYILYGSEIMLVTAIAGFRSFSLARPFYPIPELSLFRKVFVVAFILGLSSLYRLTTFLLGDREFFDPFMFTCDVNSMEEQSPLVLIGIIWSVVVPGLIICVTNVYLIYKAAKLMHSQGPNVKGTVTVILMCGAFLLSYIPFCVALGMSYVNSGERGLEFTLSNSFMGINVIINPLIYTFTNKSFCTFMQSMIGIKPELVALSKSR